MIIAMLIIAVAVMVLCCSPMLWHTIGYRRSMALVLAGGTAVVLLSYYAE